jgi:hypothetical protein
MDDYIAQVVQHRHNHETFDLVKVCVHSRPDLAEKFRSSECRRCAS